MPEQDPIGLAALSKATGISRGRSPVRQALVDMFDTGFDVVAGGLGLPTGIDSTGGRVGELLAMALPFLAATKAAKAVKAPIKAYHGSPHDFDQFSLSKIGTGEGAQTYGHGLYFADNEGVARSYRDQLSPVGAGGYELPASLSSADPVRDKDVFVRELDRVSKELAGWEQSGQAKADYMQRAVADARRVKAGIESALAGAPVQKTGRMYEVSINADPEDFLDWDAPLSQQSEKVRQAVGKVAPTIEQKAFTTKPLHDGRVQILAPTGDSMGYFQPHEVSEALENFGAGYMGRGLGQRSLTGGDLIERARKLSMKGDLSHELNQAGIPGIKYLDGASRSAGQGSRNYVVFDDKLISIVKKYGIGIALTTGLINQTQAQQLQQEGYQ